MILPPAQNPAEKLNTIKRVERFKAFYSVIRDDLLANITKEELPEDALEWYRKNLDYNIPTGNLVLGTFLVDVIEHLQGHTLSEKEYQRAAVLGWCSEFLAFFLVYDDIMDCSLMRRNGPCWYRNKDVGMAAINDAFMLESAIFVLLKAHFRSESYYADIVDLYQELVHMIKIGQMLDMITAPQDDVDLDRFYVDRQRLVTKYKAAPAYYYPVAIALVVTGTPPPSSFQTEFSSGPYEICKSILVPIGMYRQDQDDFLDYAGNLEVHGKIGSDIVDNKCSWCIVTALNLVSAEQRKILNDNYGRKDADCERRVREVFDDIGLKVVYKEYEERTVCEIKESIRGAFESENGLKQDVLAAFERLLDNICHKTINRAF